MTIMSAMKNYFKYTSITVNVTLTPLVDIFFEILNGGGLKERGLEWYLQYVKIGRSAYRIMKEKDFMKHKKIKFEIDYLLIKDNIIFADKHYKNIAVRIANLPLDYNIEKNFSYWDDVKKFFI